MNAIPPSPDRGGGKISTGLVLGVVFAIAAEAIVVALTLIGAALAPPYHPWTPARYWIAMCGLGLFSVPGAYQWIYIIPVSIHFLRKRQPQTAIGLVLAALLVMVANYVLWISLGHLHNPR